MSHTSQALPHSAGARPTDASTVEILAFDVFGTVVDWRSTVIAEGKRLGQAHGLDIDWVQFADAWRDGYGPAMNRVRRGELPWTKLDGLHRMVLDDLLVRFGAKGLDAQVKADFNRVWHRLEPWPDAALGLQRLRRRFVITTLSNGNMALLTNMAKHAGLPWDCVLSAELVRHYKPDPEVYRMVPELFDVRPDQVMMVAAHAEDLKAAQQAGLRTAFVYRPLERGSRMPPPARPAGTFDYTADDFPGLATQLGA